MYRSADEGSNPQSVARGSEPWRRSSSFEEDFFDHVMGRAGLRGPAGVYLGDQVRLRLEKGAIEYGAESYLLPGANVFGNLAEEPQDVLGWGLLGILLTYKLEREDQVSADVAAWAREELVAIAVDAARLWHRVEALRQALR
jgi:hypothetical protein